MNKLTVYFLMLMLNLVPMVIAAQSTTAKDYEAKLIGKRYVNPVYYKGPLYLYSDTAWIRGTVYLANGDSVQDLFLRYNRQQDQLIYFNQKNSMAVVLDKKPLSGFALYFEKDPAIFRKITHTPSSNETAFYEVLYDGKTDILAHRRSELKICSSYLSNGGIKKNRQYVAYNRYLVAGNENELLPVRLRKKSLLLKFGESKKKEISRIIRRKHLSMKSEASMVHAWKALEEQGYSPIF